MDHSLKDRHQRGDDKNDVDVEGRWNDTLSPQRGTERGLPDGTVFFLHVSVAQTVRKTKKNVLSEL